ncbi:hypothetical protein SAY87_012433 [Trapa incisa]|uniref:Uncharacterized protein n=1 Tax=Trapa incisa TaxID=236973 RepID=A0AAN7JC45_9MYRT|nr:hypothetical protein SAY87_012433 [Trapa incisa]
MKYLPMVMGLDVASISMYYWLIMAVNACLSAGATALWIHSLCKVHCWKRNHCGLSWKISGLYTSQQPEGNLPREEERDASSGHSWTVPVKAVDELASQSPADPARLSSTQLASPVLFCALHINQP